LSTSSPKCDELPQSSLEDIVFTNSQGAITDACITDDLKTQCLQCHSNRVGRIKTGGRVFKLSEQMHSICGAVTHAIIVFK